ncbi:MAG: hypothetical protein HYR64_08400 [Fimbriimonas ginsengisoli]|uniref:Uncharacterized protein n=1 Tax=Fimbriimonas ginsengisoli TaxID=1005039 RepID=A0A931PU72_FIMGI|nr:hypothetical protein [Fimbriimonas ginsengisoli]
MKPYKLYLLTGAGIGALVAPALFTRAEARRAPTATSVLEVNTAAQAVSTSAQGTTTVGGTVNVGNTPTVNVGNLPTTTTVAGTVNVGNTPSVSISGTPTVDVGNFPATTSVAGTVGLSAGTSVAISGTPSVNLSGIPTVNVGNGLSMPVGTSYTEHRTPVSYSGVAMIPDGYTTGSDSSIVVPPGMRLFVKSVSIDGQVISTQQIVRVQWRSVTVASALNYEIGFTGLTRSGSEDGAVHWFGNISTDFEVDPGMILRVDVSRGDTGTTGQALVKYVFNGYLDPVPGPC